MNNNYHTQIDKQNNNMLNEIAANNHLLQQQMQNFQGIPINKVPQSNSQVNTMNTPTMNPNVMNSNVMNPQLMQQLYAQQIAQQTQQNQLYQQQQKLNNQPNQQYTQQSIIDEDEIELSDTKSEPKQKTVTIDTKQPQQINKQIQQLIQNNEEQIETVTNQQTAQKNDKNTNHSKKQNTQSQYPSQIKYVPVEKSQNKILEYIVIPILLIIVFVVLIHPKTSSILEKFLPQLTNTKSILIRGVVLAIMYLVIKFIALSLSKK